VGEIIMDSVQVFYLRIAASFLVILSTLSTSVALTDGEETTFEDENNETDFASTYNETEVTDQEIGLNFRFLTPVFQMIEAGIAVVNSILCVLESNPGNSSEIENSLISLNENVEQFNASL